MSITAAIIAGAVGVTTAAMSAGGAASSSKAQEEQLEKDRKFQEEQAEKDRKLKERQMKQQGLDYLAQQRGQMENIARQKSFKNAVFPALKNVAASRSGGAAGLPTTTMGGM